MAEGQVSVLGGHLHLESRITALISVGLRLSIDVRKKWFPKSNMRNSRESYRFISITIGVTLLFSLDLCAPHLRQSQLASHHTFCNVRAMTPRVF